MAFIIKASNSDYEAVPTGPQHAVCAFVEDIGVHEGTFQGKAYSRHQLVIVWELAEKMKDGRPFCMSKFYTASLDEKANLRHDLSAWMGKDFTDQELLGFDIETMIGRNCMLNIVEKKKLDGKVTQAIGSIMPAVKGMPAMLPSMDNPPEWIAKKRAESISF